MIDWLAPSLTKNVPTIDVSEQIAARWRVDRSYHFEQHVGTGGAEKIAASTIVGDARQPA